MAVQGKSLLKLALILSSLFIIDRFLKSWALSFLRQESFLFKEKIGFSYHCNPGIAFSLPIPDLVILILTSVLMLMLIYFFIKKRDSIGSSLSLGLIFIGAFSNFLDRIKYSCVVDFISLPILPVFNLADIMIVGGCLMIIIVNSKSQKPSASLQG